MARNEEKAQAMLNRWYTQRRELNVRPRLKRPAEVMDCNSLQEAETWRAQTIKEISKQVTLIQNAGLGENRIRTLNDEINKLFREKYSWEDRIAELGGPNYREQSSKMFDSSGVELPSSGGYKYFGAAKDLPGVRELFQRDTPIAPSKFGPDMANSVDWAYYGKQIHFEELNEILEEEKKEEDRILDEEWEKFVNELTSNKYLTEDMIDLDSESSIQNLMNIQQKYSQAGLSSDQSKK
eukprot:TRINITY_DN3134_c0_g2_i1.p2 TRINITY_DN3134_c0_g2~~TRINITY_DN3134_c0_g2_i1.p2  ORF type:complete len:238 (-),score=48.47 TRINITY_DN3134_c0_g2_i1:181-894(-)